MKYMVQIKHLYNRHYKNKMIVCSAPSLLPLYTNDKDFFACSE